MKRIIAVAAILALFAFNLGAQDNPAPPPLEPPPVPATPPPAEPPAPAVPAPSAPPVETPPLPDTPPATPAEPPKVEPPKKVEPKRERRGDANRPVLMFFKEKDKDADGKLSKEEVGNDKLFGELDDDKDGFVTLAEAGKHVDKIGEEIKARAKAAAEEEFKALDKNDDKKLTEDELGDRKGLMEGDKNADKSLDLAEYTAASAAAKTARAKDAGKVRENMNKTPEDQFKEMDKNSDGKLAGDEINERLKKAMENAKADTDGDGALSLDEYKAFRAKMAEKMKDRKPREGRPGRRPGGAEPPKEEGKPAAPPPPEPPK
ncbi:MAG: hypothetical protein IT462_04520 [Planctomycetes bacterium]|nr:hypothetical protein [Planctomycetota bacterium]